MSTMRHRFLASVSLAVSTVACGGATAPLVDPGFDAGPAQPSDAGAPSPDGALPTCPSNITLAEGTSCAREGETCPGACSDPCSFCNEITCVRGVWTSVEVSPVPCVPDAGPPPRRWPTALLSWQGPSGVTGLGPALVVSGDGTVKVWASTAPFDPAAIPAAPPTTTLTVSGAAVDDLFDRWAATGTSALPHGDVGGECDGVAEEKACTTCTPTTIAYHVATALEPEMTSVWSWFSARFGQVNGGQPSLYCRVTISGLTPSPERAAP